MGIYDFLAQQVAMAPLYLKKVKKGSEVHTEELWIPKQTNIERGLTTQTSVAINTTSIEKRINTNE